MRFLVIFIGLVGFTLPTIGAELTRSATCRDSDFIQNGWPFLKQSEPALAEMVQDVGKAVGTKDHKVEMTNCWVEWPVDANGKPVDGTRTVVMDRLWYKDGEKYHAGMHVRYYKSQKDVGGTIEIYRNVKGYKLCRSPRTCEEFGIPFPGQKPTNAVASLDVF